MRSYTASELTEKTVYDFCIAVRHQGKSVRINCTGIMTRSGYIHTGLIDARNYIVGGAITSLILLVVIGCALTHLVKRYNRKKRQQQELYSNNSSQLFLASLDSMSDTTPITYENKVAEMFDDDDIEEIMSTSSMASTSTASTSTKIMA
jgi:hypothetical protein